MRQGRSGCTPAGSVWIKQALAGFLAAGALHAGPVLAGGEASIGERFYASPMYSRAFADRSRLTHDGNGGLLAVGKQLDVNVNFEFYLFDEEYKARSSSGSTTLKGVTAAFNYFPFAETRDSIGRIFNDLYILVGVGYIHASSDIATTVHSDNAGYLFEGGLGYLIPLIYDVSLRIDARYRYDQKVNPLNGLDNDSGRSGFEEPVVSVGLLVPIGSPSK